MKDFEKELERMKKELFDPMKTIHKSLEESTRKAIKKDLDDRLQKDGWKAWR